jgi:DNA-binding response OmpR family regulator
MACILLSEDDASILELMALVLAKAGHAVTAAPSNLDVLKRLGIRPEDPSAELPDLVILDVMTPKVDGYSAARAIRDHPRTRAVPILIVSGLQEIDRLFSVTVETQGFLKKPFRPDELLGLVLKILGQSEPDGRRHG